MSVRIYIEISGPSQTDQYRSLFSNNRILRSANYTGNTLALADPSSATRGLIAVRVKPTSSVQPAFGTRLGDIGD